jgi:hypothetical protein
MVIRVDKRDESGKDFFLYKDFPWRFLVVKMTEEVNSFLTTRGRTRKTA